MAVIGWRGLDAFSPQNIFLDRCLATTLLLLLAVSLFVRSLFVVRSISMWSSYCLFWLLFISQKMWVLLLLLLLLWRLWRPPVEEVWRFWRFPV